MAMTIATTNATSDVLLNVQGMNKSFGAVTAAADINVQVPAGVIWSLIGSNGAGKTTFVNLITGYLKPDSGSIQFHGQDITALAPREITRLGICRSFQIPQLCAEMSMLDNMLVSLSVAKEKKGGYFRSAHTAAAIAEATDLLERFHIVEYRDRVMAELPAGVRKLLDIAMALSGDPEVLLLDEPTSGVAAEEKYPLMDLVMGALSESNVTVLFVEHDMDIVKRYSQKVLAFYDGRIIADGEPDTVLSDPDVQRYVTGIGQ